MNNVKIGNHRLYYVIRRNIEPIFVIRKGFAVKSDKRKEIGERLAQVRALNRLSQKDVGEKIGIPWRTYQNYEVGSRDVAADFVLRFCTRFSVRQEWLLDGQDGMVKPDDLKALKPTILLVEQVVSETGVLLEAEDKADIVVRLFRKQLDGYEARYNDVVDYVELAGKKRN